MAEEIREYMAQLGFRRFEDMIGQVQHLEMNPEVLHYKSQVRKGSMSCVWESESGETSGCVFCLCVHATRPDHCPPKRKLTMSHTLFQIHH